MTQEQQPPGGEPADISIPPRVVEPELTEAEVMASRSRRNRRVTVGVIVFVALFGLGLAFRPGHHQKEPSNVGKPPRLDASNPSLTPELIAADQRANDQDRANSILSDPHAIGQGKGYVPAVTPEYTDPLAAYAATSNSTVGLGPPTQIQDQGQNPVPPPPDPKLPPVTARPQPMSGGPQPADRAGAMAALMGKMLSDREGHAVFAYEPVDVKVAALTGHGAGASGAAAGARGQGQAEPNDARKNLRVLKRDGQMLYATNDLWADSDSSNFIQATVVGGPYDGAKVQGTFRRVGEELEMAYTKIAWRNGTYKIDALAVNPDQQQVGMATEVNHHYLQRFGGVVIAGFFSGVGTAKQQEGQQIQVQSTTGTTVQSSPQRSTSDLALIGLGKGFSDSSSLFLEAAHRPITVKVAAGTPIGILFRADWVDDPQKDMPNASTAGSEGGGTLSQQLDNAKAGVEGAAQSVRNSGLQPFNPTTGK